jgi:diguanylate cyclase (GGDEF)-like protein/PAS domain S-box-containing protein
VPDFNNPEVYRSILQGLQTGVYLVDTSRRIRFWNDGAERITGYLSQDVVGHFLRDHFLAASGENGDFKSDSEDPISLVFRDGKPSITEVSILHKNGSRVPIVLRTTPIRNSHGTVFGAAETFYRNQAASDWTRRQAGLAEFGCLDEMIGVPPQSFMETQLRENMTTFTEHKIPFGILIFEVDHLDQFRSRRGSGVVPAILRVVAQTVENCLHPTDLVGCWSDHQFLAVLGECKEADVTRVGGKVMRMVAQSEMEWWSDKFSVTCSFGGAGSRVDDTWKSLAARAEKSLHESIRKGGNCVIALP